MATLMLGGLGTALGGPIGGAIGSLIGRQMDTMLFGPARGQGARLKDLAVTTSTYGATLPRHFGRMRVAGSVIWATDLVEHSETQSTSAGTVTSYRYSANFAVALSSRTIQAIGRIWADGKLLRGAEGDLKVAGTLRIHTGHGDQPCDPLIVSAEGEESTPAFRNLAYVVFEDLDLSEFYNRLPTLTFEVIADATFTLQTVLDGEGTWIDAPILLDGIVGYSSESTPAEDIQLFETLIPLEIASEAERITLVRAERQSTPILLSPHITAQSDEGAGQTVGYTRQRSAPPVQVARALRYYDVDRDYQASVQHARAQAGLTPPATWEMPAAMASDAARDWVERAARRIDWRREQITWRTHTLDPEVTPGALVRLPDIEGLWRVQQWEWNDTGVELLLERAAPERPIAHTPPLSEAARFSAPLDEAPVPTHIIAFTLPADANSDEEAKPALYAALSSPCASWHGCLLYADHGEHGLIPLGPSQKTRAIIGTVTEPLPPTCSPCIDSALPETVIVTLIDPAMTLSSTTPEGLAQGKNRALIGEELVQFLSATPLGEGRWELAELQRTCMSTSQTVAHHDADQAFVLLDGPLTPLSQEAVGHAPKAPSWPCLPNQARSHDTSFGSIGPFILKEKRRDSPPLAGRNSASGSQFPANRASNHQVRAGEIYSAIHFRRRDSITDRHSLA